MKKVGEDTKPSGLFFCDAEMSRPFYNICDKTRNCFPCLPAPLVQKRICPEFTENQIDEGLEGSTPTPEKKITCWLLQGEEILSELLTQPPLVSQAFISLSAPSSVSFCCPLQLNTTSPRKGPVCLCSKRFLFGKLAFSDSSEYPRSSGFVPMTRAGRGEDLTVVFQSSKGTSKKDGDNLSAAGAVVTG